MKLLNRAPEFERLGRLAESQGLAVVYGRRRIGKTRLLVEWARRRRGLYAVADLSAPDVQRRYLATALAEVLPGFSDVAPGSVPPDLQLPLEIGPQLRPPGLRALQFLPEVIPAP